MTTETKTSIYNRMMSTRDELKIEFVEEASVEIQKRAMLMEEFRTALRIGLYAPFRNEVRTDRLFVEGDKNRKEMYYPAEDVDEGKLSYFRIMSLEDLEPHSEGRATPSGKESKLRELNNLRVLFVPGVAFDLSGARLGFGEGFIDASLTGFNGKRIALAYDFQVVAELPHALRGRKVDWIVTEKRIIRCT